MSLTKIWIDCSGSVDDILALIILLDASDYDVVAISSVRGKTTVEQGILNIHRVLQVCKRTDIPIFCGSDEPLLASFPEIDGRYAAAENSAKSSFLSSKKSDEKIEPASTSHAAIHLVEAARRMEGVATLSSKRSAFFAVDIHFACILDPLFPLRIGKYVAVGGSEIGGDVSQAAEFNFFIDPEAVQLVMRKFLQILLITRSLGQKYVWSIEDEWLEKAETAKARLIEGILTIHEEIDDKVEWIGSTAIAAAIVGTPDLVTTSRRARCEIELVGKVTRGQSVFDFGPFKQDEQVSPNIGVVSEIDAIQFHQVLRGLYASKMEDFFCFGHILPGRCRVSLATKDL